MTCIDNCYGDEKEDLISFIFELLLDKSLLANSRRSGSKSLIKAKGKRILRKKWNHLRVIREGREDVQ